MTIPLATMIDTIHANVGSIPTNAPYVGGYVSGTSDIQWTANDWNRFSGKKSRIYQGYGPVPALLSFNEIDVESQAVTPQGAAQIHKQMIDAGAVWSTIYGSRQSIIDTAVAIRALKGNYWNGHVNCRLADWNLNEAEASAVVGTSISGVSVIGVQWASPSSNPNTIMPGSTLTLKQANADLSVINAFWVPGGGFGPPVPAPPQPTPTPPTLTRLTADFSDGTEKILIGT